MTPISTPPQPLDNGPHYPRPYEYGYEKKKREVRRLLSSRLQRREPKIMWILLAFLLVGPLNLVSIFGFSSALNKGGWISIIITTLPCSVGAAVMAARLHRQVYTNKSLAGFSILVALGMSVLLIVVMTLGVAVLDVTVLLFGILVSLPFAFPAAFYGFLVVRFIVFRWHPITASDALKPS